MNIYTAWHIKFYDTILIPLPTPVGDVPAVEIKLDFPRVVGKSTVWIPRLAPLGDVPAAERKSIFQKINFLNRFGF